MDNKDMIARIVNGETLSNEELNEMFTENLKKDAESHKLGVSFVNESDNPDPVYAKQGDSGFDLRANLRGSVTLGSLEREIIPTGLYFELPFGTEMQVRPRSGLAAKNGVSVLNTPGTVDQGYRGEIGVILVNLSKDEFVINHGDRIAQAVISPVVASTAIRLDKVEEINKDTDRGVGAYGSTGVS